MDVDEEELDEGDALICEECGANLNVSGTSPLEITPAKDDDVDDDDEMMTTIWMKTSTKTRMKKRR